MHGGGTLLYDAVYLASDEVTKKQKGRKAVIILSDGVDRGSKESLQEAIATAQRADTQVYTVLFADKDGYGGQRGGFGGPHVGMGGGGMGVVAAVSVGLKSPVQMGKKYWNKSREKRAAAFLRSPKSNRSIRFILRSMRSYVISTAWVTRPKKPTLLPGTTRFL